MSTSSSPSSDTCSQKPSTDSHSATDASKSYDGSCHCGAVKYKAKIDLSKGTGKCNCSICAKTRSWGVIIKPSEFNLLSGENSLTDYQFGGRSMHHLFCKVCGVRPYGKGNIEALGGEFYFINVACLDNVAPEEIGEPKISFANGSANDWYNAPTYTKHL